MTRIHDHYTESSRWIGRLSASVAVNSQRISDDPKTAQKELRETLAKFIASDVPDEGLRELLRRYLK